VLQEPNNQKKLTDREVKEIRNLARTSDLTQREIADCYAVNPATVSRIVRGVYHK
jgi:DNA-binding MarR family transcriptional regulator